MLSVGQLVFGCGLFLKNYWCWGLTSLNFAELNALVLRCWSTFRCQGERFLSFLFHLGQSCYSPHGNKKYYQSILLLLSPSSSPALVQLFHVKIEISLVTDDLLTHCGLCLLLGSAFRKGPSFRPPSNSLLYFHLCSAASICWSLTLSAPTNWIVSQLAVNVLGAIAGAVYALGNTLP